MIAFLCGVGFCALLFVAYFAFQEWRSSRCHRHRLHGNYSDARQPFRIERGPQPHVQRSEELIAREARRAMRAGSYAGEDASASTTVVDVVDDALRREGRGC